MNLVFICLFIGVINRIISLGDLTVIAILFGKEQAKRIEKERNDSFDATVKEAIESAQGVPFLIKFVEISIEIIYNESMYFEVLRYLLSCLPVVNIALLYAGIKELVLLIKKTKVAMIEKN